MSELHFVIMPHTHWDREWYLPMEVFRRRLVRLMDRLVDIMDADPEYRFFYLDGQTIVLEDYEEIRGRNSRLERLIKGGRIEIGPWYILPDEFLVSGESLIRNLKIGFEVAEGYGIKPAMVGYLPDMFGHTSQMPQILQGFGIEHAVVWRGMPSEIKKNQFRWQAPDGSFVLTAFLPLGYGVTFNFPDDPKELRDRLRLFLAGLSRNDPSGVYLLPLGTDHWEPEEHIPERMKEVTGIESEWSFEMAGLLSYFNKLKPVLKELPEWTGELRSSSRTVIIPSVASSRLYLKQRDFRATSLIERYLEPLSGWAMVLGGPNPEGFLHYLWKLLLTNHPHDSICGCSVDSVHDEMQARYAKVIQLAERLTHEAVGFLAEKIEDSGPGLCLWNPTPTQSPGIICGELEGRIPNSPVLVVPDGSEESGTLEIPLQVLETKKDKEDFFEIEVPGVIASLAMIMFANEELFGAFIQCYRVRECGEALELQIDLGTRPRDVNTDQMARDVDERLVASGLKKLKIRVLRLPRHRVAARIPAFSGFTISKFKLKRGKASGFSGTLKAAKDLLESDVYSIRLEGDGSLSIEDKKRKQTIHGLKFLDVADRGDTYNFDPLSREDSVTKPNSVSSRLIAKGPHAAVMEIKHSFKVPESLNRARDSRSRRTITLKLQTTVTLYAGDTERIEFITRFKNTARDHRLQVAFDAPFITEKAWVENAFAAVPRSTDPGNPAPKPDMHNVSSLLFGTEATYSTSPQRTFACISSGAFGIGIFNRGLAEVDTVRLEKETRLALTLVRSIGYLSRGDLRTRRQDAGPPLTAPGAQCLRECRCEYALTSFTGSWEEANMVARAHHYAFPPLLFVSGVRDEGEKKIKSGTGLFSVDNPRIDMSALFISGPEFLDLRLYNTGTRMEKTEITFSDLIREVKPVDLLGKPASGVDFSFNKQRARLQFRPGQIITLKLDLR